MGWFAYGIYDGDCTQTEHFDHIKAAGVKASEDEIGEWLTIKGTIIPKKHLSQFSKGLNKVVRKMPSARYFTEDKAIEWQMLLALCLDNGIKPPSILKEKGIAATLYLMGDHAEDFDKPFLRRRKLNEFLEKVKKA